MYKLASLTLFATAFLITANIQIYIHSLRIGIYSWHVFLPVIPLQVAIIIALGSWRKLYVSTWLFILWWFALCFAIGISLMIVTAENGAVSVAAQMVTFGIIGISFVIAAKHTVVAKAGMLGIATAVLLAGGISIAEFFDPSFDAIIDQRYQKQKLDGQVQRVGGLHGNPNLNACVMVLGMLASVFSLPKRLRLLFCLFIGVSVFTTVSRAGISGWFLSIVLLTILGQFSSRTIAPKLIFASLLLALAVALTSGVISTFVEDSGVEDYMTERMVERLSSNFFTQEDGSTSTRKALAVAAIELYSQNAILGTGLNGASDLLGSDLAAHNTILDIAAELGTIGLLAYLSVIIILVYSRSAKATAFFIVFIFFNMFIHRLIAIPSLAFILPAGVVLLSQFDQNRLISHNRPHRKKRRKKTSSSQNQGRARKFRTV